MKIKRRRKKPGFVRQVLALNTSRFLDHCFKDSRNKPLALAKAAGVSLSTVQRILAADVGASVDSVEAIAAVFQLSAYQLLLVGQEVDNPLAIVGAAKKEEQLFRVWMRSRN